MIFGIVGVNPCVRPAFPRYSGALHGQTRGPAPTGCSENRVESKALLTVGINVYKIKNNTH